jgi:hypothetical protein
VLKSPDSRAATRSAVCLLTKEPEVQYRDREMILLIPNNRSLTVAARCWRLLRCNEPRL